MRRLLPVLLLAVIPALQGCFPVVATGVGAGALMAGDRRTSGTYIEDQGIELKASNRIEEKFKYAVHANVTSFNRHVLLTGEVPSEAVKQEVGQVVMGVPNVIDVTNEMAIGNVAPFSARSNDTYITSKVKARMIDANRFAPHHVKVITESGVVYLMGMVTRKEAEDAAEIARTTTDVRKVVKIFEYLD
ncbi:MAG: BON domain-containing protein [Sulfurimicrobium sp.]|jgi:osmotically-inducible protein OsmY|nr:BON domain-containing protein [Sulfurimicrobium sp.]MDP1705274.1 BON domain-containing protein [Sulfurimicrobium sp.]MDP2199637.1 BON domain-containing protein [Sulfurimicrobium sp.]MDP2961166.1 BON domain-containing protein [Sulfurimicrobium sp.]MDZ7655643.1 BON domain-containing protein [Sulfurimicrobium sp.]